MFIIVLGGGIDLSGNLPSFVYQRLDKAIELYKKNPGSQLVACGKYSFLYGKQKPPLTEADKMLEYFLKKGLPKKDVLLEKNSRDTIGNAYYLKKLIFMPRNERRAIILTSHFHLERVRFIFQKIFGPNYKLHLGGVLEKLGEEEKNKIIQRQKELLQKTKIILDPMKDGDHDFLKGKLYKIKYYREKRPSWVTNFVAKGKT